MKKTTTPLFLLVAALTIVSLFQNAGCSNPAPDNQEVKTDTAHASNPTFLFLSDIHLNTFDSSTAYGGDTGLKLWENFLAKADSLLAGESSPDFIVYTGDLPAHYSCSEGCYLAPDQRADHNANITAILKGLKSLADKYHKPLFYLPGNNDGLAGDYYSFADANQQTPLSLVPDTANPYPALNILSGTSAPCMVSMPHPTMGYYSVMPVPGLRLVAMNTVMFSKNFVAVDSTAHDADRAEEMNWLIEQLSDATVKGEKVYIAMHIPPGEDAYSGKSMWYDQPVGNSTLLKQFLTITNDYKSIISGILYGHTHMDEVRRLYDTTGTTITEVAICCPGVTPQHNNNPGFKIVEYDAKSKELMNFTTYYSTPTSASWGNASYTYNSTFGGNDTTSIFQSLSVMPIAKASSAMSTIYTVKNGAPGYDVTRGIEVKVQ